MAAHAGKSGKLSLRIGVIGLSSNPFLGNTRS